VNNKVVHEDPHIRNLGTRWRPVVSFSLRSLHSPGKQALLTIKQ
jgi:hypothetical protein